MWLVQSLVEENNGTVSLLGGSKGFGLTIRLLNKLKKYEKT
jgi:hypothetical protein